MKFSDFLKEAQKPYDLKGSHDAMKAAIKAALPKVYETSELVAVIKKFATANKLTMTKKTSAASPSAMAQYRYQQGENVNSFCLKPSGSSVEHMVTFADENQDVNKFSIVIVSMDGEQEFEDTV